MYGMKIHYDPGCIHNAKESVFHHQKAYCHRANGLTYTPLYLKFHFLALCLAFFRNTDHRPTYILNKLFLNT